MCVLNLRLGENTVYSLSTYRTSSLDLKLTESFVGLQKAVLNGAFYSKYESNLNPVDLAINSSKLKTSSLQVYILGHKQHKIQR